jgi:uracil-DNA glycosylase
MIFKELWDLLEHELFLRESTAELFNQYQDRDLSVDLPDANEIRKENLWNYLNSFSERPSILMVGEAAGPWGCRFSGVPFTGEKQLCESMLPFFGHQSSKNNPSLKIKRFPPHVSLSAKIFWEILKPFHPKFFVWDCIPLHPHKVNKILSVRNPTSREVLAFSDLLRKIVEIIRPRQILSIGREAEKALTYVGTKSSYICHPSHGGANKFEVGVKSYF